MDDLLMEESEAAITVLHLDDNKEFTEVAARFLEQEHEELAVEREDDPETALDRLTSGSFDCVVCDYDMPVMDGLEFLDAVRDVYTDLPFILFTGKGGEEIASEAISRGVTDYLQKDAGRDQYTVLANRIQNAVAQRRAEREIETRTEWYRRILQHSSDYVLIVNDMGKVSYVSPSIERVMGYSPDEIIGRDAFEYVHPEDFEAAAESLAKTIEDPGREVTAEFRSNASDGTYRWLEARGSSFRDDPLIDGVMVNVRDITARKEHEEELKRQNERLEQFASIVSHDLRNPLNVALGRLDLAYERSEVEHLTGARRALERMSELIDNLLELARSGQPVTEPESVRLNEIGPACWANVETMDATIRIDTDAAILADKHRLKQLLENLFRNAIEHNSGEVTVTVGSLDDGFYVADDGVGIEAPDGTNVFDPGFSTSGRGSGFGLTIAQHVAAAHDWDIHVRSGDLGGARFEITGVKRAEDAQEFVRGEEPQ